MPSGIAGWTASAKWGEAPALDGQTAMPLGVRLSDGLGGTVSTLQVRFDCDTATMPCLLARDK